MPQEFFGVSLNNFSLSKKVSQNQDSNKGSDSGILFISRKNLLMLLLQSSCYLAEDKNYVLYTWITLMLMLTLRYSKKDILYKRNNYKNLMQPYNSYSLENTCLLSKTFRKRTNQKSNEQIYYTVRNLFAQNYLQLNKINFWGKTVFNHTSGKRLKTHQNNNTEN